MAGDLPAVPAAGGGAIPKLLRDGQQRLLRLLEAPLSDTDWPAGLEALRLRLRDGMAESADEMLFMLIAGKSRLQERYSSHHALACASIVDLAADALGWSEDERRTLVCAALTMNISITALQDELAHRERTLTVEQRHAVAAHAPRSAERLRALGVDDALWLDTVSLHHTPPADALLALPPAERLAALLRRVDVFLAKISPRAGRPGLPTTHAARDACLGSDGRPDAIGAAILRALGLYPPGSVVVLRNGETAVVVQRGARMDQPVVASIAGADRQPWVRPMLRRTAEAPHAIKAPAGRQEARIPWDPLTLFDAARSLGA